MLIIESALGVEKAFEIASSSKNNCALAVGLEDYTADLGTQRSNDGIESFMARSKIVNAVNVRKIKKWYCGLILRVLSNFTTGCRQGPLRI